LKNEKPQRKLLTIEQISNKNKKIMRERYGNISQVPPGLYCDIIRQFRQGGQPVLFDI
jgi:hypothetical protein